jgi:hypothetical protein
LEDETWGRDNLSHLAGAPEAYAVSMTVFWDKKIWGEERREEKTEAKSRA